MRRRAKDVLFIHQAQADTNIGEAGSGVVSKDRKGDYGEVYTPHSVVNFMWSEALVYSLATNQSISESEYAQKKRKRLYENKVKGIKDYGIFTPDELQRIMFCKVLEPSCGHGNFVEVIITDKIRALFRLLKKICPPNEWANDWTLANLLGIVFSITALDILKDNVIITRNRMFLIINRVYKKLWGKPMPLSVSKIFAYALRIMVKHCNSLLPTHIHIVPKLDYMRYSFWFYFTDSYLERIYDKDYLDAGHIKYDYKRITDRIHELYKDESPKKQQKLMDKRFKEQYPDLVDKMYSYDNLPKQNEQITPIRASMFDTKSMYELYQKLFYELIDQKYFDDVVNCIDTKEMKEAIKQVK